MVRLRLLLIFTVNTFILSAQMPKISLRNLPQERKVEVLVDGQLFTAYCYPHDSVMKKPVLFPVASPKGTMVTRGYPMQPRDGERVDHPHHVGVWQNYESVNGYDFWNNSTAIKDRSKYGTIKHVAITKSKAKNNQALIETTADWIVNDGKGAKVATEITQFKFQAQPKWRIIDRTTTIKAQKDSVHLKDVKDGFFAIRVARELEHPNDKADFFTDSRGIVTKLEKLDNSRITGNYRSSEGIEGEAVWGTRARWMNLRGRIGQEDISVAIIDHPQNLSYPSYWHARGYGLFAVNPLGAKIFSNGKDVLNFSLSPGQEVTFRYRLVIASHHLSDAEMEALAAEFAK